MFSDATISIDEKVRMQNMALSLVAFGQGIPFFHAGDDMLRSKSGDGDSYDSGDWFNAIDFSYNSNNWGIGLPPEWRNKNEWSLSLGSDLPSGDYNFDILVQDILISTRRKVLEYSLFHTK